MENHDIVGLTKSLLELENHVTQGPWSQQASEDNGAFKDRTARFHYDDMNRVLIGSPHCKDHVVGDFSCNHTCIERMTQEDNAEFVCKLRNAFPTLARSLLLAMEALEKMKGPTDTNDKTVIAHEALTAIRSPTLNDHQQ